MSELDPYYYAREHDGSGWSVRGPDGFVIKIMAGMDKNVAYIIAKLLSGQWDDADALLHSLAKMMKGLSAASPARDMQRAVNRALLDEKLAPPARDGDEFMSDKFTQLLAVGRDLRYGGMDFRVSVEALSREELDAFIVMTHYALTEMTELWKQQNSPKATAQRRQ